MPRNGSGTYTRVAGTPYVYNTVISETTVNSEMDDIATAITGSIAKDGQTTPTANLPMGTYRHTGVGNGSARTDYAAMGQVQDGKVNWVDGGGTADAITATYSPAITALVDGQLCFVRATAANATTTPTFAPNGLTARTIVKKGGSALVAGDIVADGHELILRYDLTNTRWELLNPGSYAGLGANTFTDLQIWKASADIASAATVDLSTATGNVTRITGTTAVSAWTMNAGQWHMVIADGALPLTYHATTNKLNTGGANYTCAAGDRVLLHKDNSGIVQATIYTTSGKAVSAGKLVQRVEATPFTTYASDASGSLPIDDTIPQKGEGGAYCSVSITPKSSTNRLVIKGIAQVGGNGANTIGVTLVDTAINDCLAAVAVTIPSANYQASIPIEHEMEAGSTSARTYQLRIGAAAGVTFFVNGATTARLLGGKMGCRLWVEEIAV